MPRFSYKKLEKYPHLGPADVEIWERFIDQSPRFFQAVDYDVKVGEGIELPEESEEPYKSDMKYLSKKRIDVVGYADDQVYVIELKPRAGLQALGQAAGLAELYAEEMKKPEGVHAMIITDEKMPDIGQLAHKMGVLYTIVGK